VLKVTPPRPSLDAAVGGGGRLSFASVLVPAFEDDPEPRVRRLSRQEAEAIRLSDPPLSPWKVVLAQAIVGFVAAAVAGAIGGLTWAASAFYGAAVVALPSLVMARATTSRLASLSPALGTASLLGWGFVKMFVSVFMLALAPRVVAGLVWPVMLATLFIAMQTYWFALLVRGRKK